MYFDHGTFELALLFSLVFLLAIRIWRHVEMKRSLLRIPARSASILLGASSSLLLLIDGCVHLIAPTDASARIYSPDRRHVIVVRDWDAGALGGTTTVSLYSHKGLNQDTIAGGDWKAVEAQDVHWTSNTELLLRYYNQYPHPPFCRSTASIHVTCVSKP